MWTFRKALVAAAVLLALFLFLRASHDSSPNVPVDTKSTTPFTNTPAGIVAEGKGNVNAEPPLAPPATPEISRNVQRPIEDMTGKPLREQIRYNFPYDLASKLPAYIWQTWKYTPADGGFDESLRPFEASWSEKHPGFIHEVVNDEQADHLIKYLYAAIPDVYEAYESLPVPVLKADFFRYLILLARGGIYTDIDTIALKPTMEWLPEGFKRENVGLIIGIEADADRPDWAKWYSRRVQFCQWTIQSKPGHPVLVDIVAKITEETLRMKKEKILREGKMDKTIVEFTGPGAWTDSVMNYFNNPNYFDLRGKNITAMDFTKVDAHKQVGDVMVLPITSFSPGVGQMGAKEPDHPLAFVKHEFEGKKLSASSAHPP
ncbi:putative alpha-mannosyltransferase subunit [Phaeomoniella chlamydospora]|uniref:Putative alpha-mannosyltransferase subunit n=1 Tax=Phaeomoniella chlamydospora TaxID=158046 RepID=A0A0G2E7Z9_PHACM|nr:putative alpha-mannosyltransferase subunit [Phaeomoniella chlamydospora]